MTFWNITALPADMFIREISAPRRMTMSVLSVVQQNPSSPWQTAPWRARLREYAIRWRFMAPMPAIHTPSRKIFQSTSWLRFGNTASRCRVWKSRRQPAAVMWTERWLRTRDRKCADPGTDQGGTSGLDRRTDQRAVSGTEIRLQ